MSDIPQLPAILDPLLDYLDEHLPPQLYSFITSFLSHSIALLTALISLVSSLLASKPWEWDAQTIIPPLISFLAAYLALVSLYRTTSWIFRTTFWFIKWGTILGVLAAGAGWYMGNNDINGGGRGLVSTLGAILLNALNSDGRDGVGARMPETTPRTSKRRTKPWESFENQWQYREDNPAQARDNDAQRIMSDIVAAANRVLMEGGWWDAAKSAFTQSDPQSGKDGRSTKRQGNRSSRR